MSAQPISLQTSDGHTLSAYEARPDKSPRGGIVLLQEIFGLTSYIRRVCDGFAAHGYHVLAPALFDRIRPGIVLGYSKDDAIKGREFRAQIPWDKTFNDVRAAMVFLQQSGKVATLGYCWGGTISWRAACQIESVSGAVCYYGTQISPYTSEHPRCPVLMHFGDRDSISTLDHAGALRASQGAQVEIQVYPAGHGFSCDETPNYHAASANLALQRSLDFLSQQIG
ncbi:MAG TPA: dienelactone hydrolase family protein [Pseudolabrys sp.]|nr:dienelactone hydrolase family protein [Pseudolabrys sp.]